MKEDKIMTFAYILQIKGGRVRLRCKMIIMCKVWIKVYASNYLHLQKMEEKKVNYISQNNASLCHDLSRIARNPRVYKVLRID